MIKIENIEISGWDTAIRSVWNTNSDSYWTYIENPQTLNTAKFQFFLGEKDLKSMRELIRKGHTDFLRMINVSGDITAPLYWWNEFDIYKVGTACNRCSMMYKIIEKEFTLHDFSIEHIGRVPNCDPRYEHAMEGILMTLNEARHCFLDTKDKAYLWQIIQLLPSSYNLKHTVHLNYQDLYNICRSQAYQSDEWWQFGKMCESLPYFTEICGDQFLQEDCER